MYYLIELKNQPLYEVTSKAKSLDKILDKLTTTNIIVSDYFLENNFTLIKPQDIETLYYYEWSLKDVAEQKRAYVDLLSMHHFILVFNKWEIVAKLKKVDSKYFYFCTNGGLELYLTNFKQGDPYNSNISDSI
jgi:hypothetical protein